MATREITVTLKIDSNHSDKTARRLLELCLCDTTYSHSTGNGAEQKFRIVGVDAGACPVHVSLEPYRFSGVTYTHIFPWERA